ncbi:MAG: hypothetical protein LUC44_01705, partial [Prevotellaceae bacterium]|nr:hypothetical protein [Prevotellaceae bacterium]
MQNRTLSFLVACLMGMAAYAQWTAPEQPTAASELISGRSYMVRNADSDGLYLAGSTSWYSWSTSLMLVENSDASTPITYKISQETDDDGNTGWTFMNISTQKYTFISGLISAEEGSNLYAYNGFGEMHIDMDGQGHNLFDITEQDAANHLYRIKVVETDTVYGEQTGYWGFIKDDGTYPNAVYAFLDPSDSNNCCDWEFVDYTNYEALVTLYETLLQAAEAGIDTSDASAVYNNSSATLEEIEAASDVLSAAVKDALMGGATKDNPVDVTSLIENNDFSTGDISGWDCTFVSGTSATNLGYQSASYTNEDVTYINHEGAEVNPFVSGFIEAWASSGNQFGENTSVSRNIGDGELSQTMKSLPAGQYKLSADAIAVQQDNTALTVSGVHLFATGGTIDNYISIATGNGVPEHFELTFVSTGGDVTLGLRTVYTDANWIAADNFELMYYGAFEGSAYYVILQNSIEAAQAYTDTETYHYSTAVLSELQAAIATAQNLLNGDATDDELIAGNEALEAEVAVVKADIQAYENFQSYLETMESDRDTYNAAGFDDISDTLADLYDSMSEHYTNCDLSAEEIQAQIDAYTDLLKGLLEDALQYATEDNPIDVTLLYLQNADFSDGVLDPWENTTGVLVYSGDTFPNSDCNLWDYNDNETYNHAIQGWVASSGSLGDEDVHQTITDLPAGSYVLSCSMVAQHSTDMPSGVYLYTNGLVETTTEMTHDEELWNSLVAAGTTNQLMEHPKHVFYHTGGDLTFGLRLVSTNCNWVYASKFTLSYAGESISALYAAMQAMKEQAAVLEDEAMYINQADQLLQNAIVAADDCPEDDEETITAVMEQLQEAMDYANEAIELASTLEYNFTIYSDYLMGEVESDYEGYEDLLDEIGAAIDDGYESKEQIENYISSMASGFTAYVQYPFLETSSEENPGDITAALINANFEGVAGGDTNDFWTVTRDGGTESGSYEAYECYNNTSFDVSQTVTGLADGYYRVRVQGFYRPGTNANNADSLALDPEYGQNVVLYANSVSTPICNVIEGGTTTATGFDGETSVTYNDETLYLPNTMSSFASYVQDDPDRYWTAVDVHVEG